MTSIRDHSIHLVSRCHGKVFLMFCALSAHCVVICCMSFPCVRLSHAAQQAYSLAMLHFSVPSVAAACVCFCELLGVCSLKLRVDLKALSLILRLRTQRPGGTSTFSLKDLLGKPTHTHVCSFFATPAITSAKYIYS